MSDGVSIPVSMDDSLTPGLKEAEKAVKSFATGAMVALGPIGIALTALTAAVTAVNEAFSFASNKLTDWVNAAADAQDVQAKLEGQVEATGKAAGFTAEQLDIMATNIAKVTRNEDDAVKGAQSMLLKFTSIRGDIFADAIKSSANLAEVLGGGMSSAASMLGRALDDPVRGLMMLRRAGVTFTESQKEAIKTMIEHGDKAGAQKAILDAVEAKVGGMAEKMAGTWNGVWENLTNRWGEFGETIGAVVLPYLEELLPIVEQVVTVIENLVPVVAEALDGFLKWGAALVKQFLPSMEDVVIGIAVGVATVEVYMERWRDAIKFVGAFWAAKAVEYYNVTVHYFKELLPAVFRWYAQQQIATITDIAIWLGKTLTNMYENWKRFHVDLLATVSLKASDMKWESVESSFKSTLENMFKNWKSFLLGLEEGVKGSFEWKSMESLVKPLAKKGFKWSALGQEFEATVVEFPEIVERVKTPLEEELAKLSKELQDSLAGDITDRSVEIANKIRDLMRVHLGDVGDPTNFQDINMDQDTIAKKAKAKAKEEQEKKARADKDRSSGGGLESLQALHERISNAAAALTPGDKKIVEAIEKLQPPGLNMPGGPGAMALGKDQALIDEKARADRAEALLKEQRELLGGLVKNTASLPKLQIGLR